MLAKRPNNPRVPHIPVEKNRPDEDVLDEVYLRFAQSDPFLPIIHCVDHATMGPEALVDLGSGGKVEKWISRHRVRLYKPPAAATSVHQPGRPFSSGRTPTAIGYYFAKELENQPFQDVIARWMVGTIKGLGEPEGEVNCHHFEVEHCAAQWNQRRRASCNLVPS